MRKKVNNLEELSKSMLIVRTLKQIMSSLKKNVECQYKSFSLTGPQGMLMGTLAHCGEMKVSDLSEKLYLSNSTVSGIIDRLEKQGLVERIRSEEDRRVVYVKITPEFKIISEQHFKKIQKEIEMKMSKASPEELDKIQDGLNALKNLLE